MNTGTVLICSSLILIVFLFYIFLSLKSKINDKKYKMAFENTYKYSLPIPKYELRYSYGYPSFTITFDSAESLIIAEEKGLNHKFLRDIQELCKDIGSKDNLFNAERAVFFTTVEHWENLNKWIKNISK